MGKDHMAYDTFTTASGCFLPFLMTENPDEVIGGSIRLHPVLTSDEIEALLKKITAEYPEPCLENGYLFNLADLFSLSISLYPIAFTDGHFAPIDKRFLGLGAKAVVICDPMEFMKRLGRAVAIRFPNIRFLDAGRVQYGTESEPWGLYNRSQSESWGNEFLITAKLNPALRIISGEPVRSETFSIGDLSPIAKAVSVEDLISGNFSAELAGKSFMKHMNSYIPKEKAIQDYSFSFMADLKAIVPDKNWLSKFETALGAEWVANTSVERLYADGDALPRLVYHSVNRTGRIHIGINRMDFSFAQYTDRERKLLNDLICIIDGELDLRYCRMSVVTNANLGAVTEAIAADNAFVKETKIKIHKGLQVTHDLETGYFVRRNILGIDSPQRAWHYTIKTETPECETTPWYRLSDVTDFFEEVSGYHAEVIRSLLKGDAYAGYRKI